MVSHVGNSHSTSLASNMHISMSESNHSSAVGSSSSTSWANNLLVKSLGWRLFGKCALRASMGKKSKKQSPSTGSICVRRTSSHGRAARGTGQTATDELPSELLGGWSEPLPGRPLHSRSYTNGEKDHLVLHLGVLGAIGSSLRDQEMPR